MPEVCSLIWLALVGAFRSRVSLEAENTILRHQLNVLRRQSPKRPTFGMLDRLIFAGLHRLAPKVLGALAIVKPETVIKWHRAGFRSYWRWKSRRRGGRPTVAPELRKLFREMRIANPLWGAPRIHGELLKLGIDIGQTSVAEYMAKRRVPQKPRTGMISGAAIEKCAGEPGKAWTSNEKPPRHRLKLKQSLTLMYFPSHDAIIVAHEIPADAAPCAVVGTRLAMPRRPRAIALLSNGRSMNFMRL
jgi:hypothetical protein